MDWVRSQIAERLGFSPYPGTLNLKVPEGERDKLRALDHGGSWIEPAEGFRRGRVFKALIMGMIQGGVVRPEVAGYPEDLIEVLAPLPLREALGLKDGDEVEVEVWLE